MEDIAHRLVEEIRLRALGRPTPFLVAIDGRSGAGKSTIAAEVAGPLQAVVIEGDDFYRGGSADEWDRRSPADKVALVIDWRRQRRLLQQLRQGRGASWYPFDWHRFDCDAFDGRLSKTAMSAEPSAMVILEGAYTARPELADLLDLRVLLDTPLPLAEQRLRAREGAEYSEDWEGRWRSAEDHYFGEVMPRAAFDLVISAGDH